MVREELTLQELEELKNILKSRYEEYKNCEKFRDYALICFNHASTIQVAINIIKDQRNIIDNSDKTIIDLSAKVNQLEAKEVEPIIKERIETFIDDLICELEYKKL